MDGDGGVAAIELAAALGDKKDRSDFTAVPAALSEQWNLPRPEKHATGMFSVTRTGIDLCRRPGMDGDYGVGPVQPGPSDSPPDCRIGSVRFPYGNKKSHTEWCGIFYW